MVTLLLANAFLLTYDPRAFGPERFASQALAVPFSHLAPRASHLAFRISWWAHALLILAFLNYLPYSKHLHVATSLFNVYFSNTNWNGERAGMRPMDLEAEGVEQFG